MTPEIFTELIIKYITNSNTADELDVLNEYINEAQYDEIFKAFIKTNYVIDFKMKEFDTPEAKRELIEFIRKDKTKVAKRKSSWFKYTAAASIFLVLAFTLFFKEKGNPVEPLEPIIVNNQIETGTDKAT
ncbi:MAG: hypothetical protein AB3N18_13225, partial [Allomuricauda sp.]